MLGFFAMASAQHPVTESPALPDDPEAIYQQAEKEWFENFRSDKALSLYREAASRGHRDAKYKVIKILRETTLHGWNSAEVISLYRSLAVGGHIEAKRDLAFLKHYLYKTESEIGSEVEALFWLEKLAKEQNDTDSQFFLAEMLSEGLTRRCLIHEDGRRDCSDETIIEGQIVSDGKVAAAYWYKQAAMKGDDLAQVRLAKMFETGDGVPQDESQAAFWYEQAALQDNSVGMVSFAEMLFKGVTFRCFIHKDMELCQDKNIIDGQVVADNKLAAAYWYQEAGIRGDNLAKIRLAKMFETGDGVPQHKESALFWYQEVTGIPYPEIIHEIQIGYYDITEMEYYMTAQMHLADMFERESGIRQNKVFADHWYDQVAITGRAFITTIEQLIQSANSEGLNDTNAVQFQLNEITEKGKEIPRIN